jgi:glycogen debranching enzyme
MQKQVVLLLILFLLPIGLAQTADEIAEKDLRSLYREEGIFAGENQFSDYWARDALFATLGSNSLSDYDISKKQLQLYINHQNEVGQIPMRVGDYDITLKVMGINFKQAQKPRYDQDKLFTNPRDQNCLFVIAAEDYILNSGDTAFAEDNFESFENAIQWLAETDKNNNFLIEEGNFAGWTDSVKKKGEVLYTNVCYYKSLKSISNLAVITNQPAKAQIYSMWAEIVKSKINENFWLEQGYYADWTNKNTKYNYFSTDANVLAILWGVAGEDQTKQILQYSIDNNLNRGFGVQTTSPEYKRSLISPINILAGIEDYHTNMRWLWVSCLYTKALNENGFERYAELELAEIKKQVESDGTIYEVYEPDGSKVNRWMYRSENPFAWSSGVCTYVFNDMN